MAQFSIQDAALSGFAAVRAHPRALLVWTPVAFIISVIAQVVFIETGGHALDWSVLTQDPAKVSALAAKVLPSELAFLAIGLVANAFVQAAMMRLVFSPEKSRFGYFRLGADELRQLGLEVLAMVVLLGGYFGCILVASIVVAAVAGTGAGNAVGLSALTAGVTGACVLLIFAAVRLSLAAPLTFDTGRIDLFGSWRLTQGHFWAILGTYVLMIALLVAIWLFANVLFFGLARLVVGPDIAALVAAPGDLVTYFTPTRLIVEVFSAFVTALFWPVIITPSARIYRSLKPAPVRLGDGPHPWG